MKLYLIQHAEAKREEEDPAKPLSEQGWSDIRRLKNFLEARDIRVHGILHSGKLRAKQTAETLGEALFASEDVKETEGLAPVDDPSIWARKLRELEKDIALVGHLPHLSKLSGLLLAGDQDKKILDFKRGCIVCLEKKEGKWNIQWMVTPHILTSTK